MRMESRFETEYREIAYLTDECFSGIERPPDGVLLENYRTGQVFVNSLTRIDAFAIVTERFGDPWLWMAGTHPYKRGQGLMSDLLKEIEVWARETHRSGIALTCKAGNPAQKVYFDAGYRVEKVLIDYYRDDNGLLMRRKLL